MTKPTVTYILGGPLTGKTVTLGEFPFIDGKFTTSTYTEDDLKKLDLWLWQWQGKRVYGKCEVCANEPKEVQGGVSEGGGTPTVETVAEIERPADPVPVEARQGLGADGDRQAESVAPALPTGKRGKRARKH